MILIKYLSIFFLQLICFVIIECRINESDKFSILFGLNFNCEVRNMEQDHNVQFVVHMQWMILNYSSNEKSK